MITDLLPISTPEMLAMTDLAPTAKGVLVGTMVGATLLLLFGAQLLRPAVVLAAMLVGFLGSVVVARALLPGVPLWAAAAFGAVAGLLAGALLYRPTVGLMAGVVGAAVGALIAFAIIAGGTLDTAPRNLNHALVVNTRETVRPGEGSRAGKHLLEILVGPRGVDESNAKRTATDAALSDAADSALPAGDRVLRSTVDVAHRAGDRVEVAFQETAPAYRTLLTASIAAGAVAGFLMGLLATTLVARILTSLAGAWLLVVGALPLLAMHGYEPMPTGARGWLIVLVSMAILGTLAQSALGSGKAPKRSSAGAGASTRAPAAKQSSKSKSPTAPKAVALASAAD